MCRVYVYEDGDHATNMWLIVVIATIASAMNGWSAPLFVCIMLVALYINSELRNRQIIEIKSSLDEIRERVLAEYEKKQ